MTAFDDSPPTRRGHAEALAHRGQIDDMLARLAGQANSQQDPAFSFAVRALAAVHNLYDGYDGLASRGTAEQRTRIDIHNAIVEVALTYVTPVASDVIV